SACNLVFKRAPKRVVAAIDRDPAFGIDRLSTALLDYGDAHATFTVGTQAGSSAWGTHQQLTVLGGSGWLRFNFPYAHARPSACSIELGDASTVGSVPTSTFNFEPMNHYALEVDRFSRLLLDMTYPVGRSRTPSERFAPLRHCSSRAARGHGNRYQMRSQLV